MVNEMTPNKPNDMNELYLRQMGIASVAQPAADALRNLYDILGGFEPQTTAVLRSEHPLWHPDRAGANFHAIGSALDQIGQAEYEAMDPAFKAIVDRAQTFVKTSAKRVDGGYHATLRRVQELCRTSTDAPVIGSYAACPVTGK